MWLANILTICWYVVRSASVFWAKTNRDRRGATSFTEIAPKSPLLCVNRSPSVRYDFRAGTTKLSRPKGILSHISFVFFRGKKRYFSLKNMKYKYHISCQFVDTTHLRLICIRRMKSCSSSTRKKPKKKRLPSFLHMFSKVQHLKGLITFGDN